MSYNPGRRMCFVRPGCLMPPWAAARPRAAHAACCCLWRRWCSGRRRARPPARSPHASLTARSGRSRGPPVPSGPSGALHTSGAGSLIGGSARRFEARPGPAGPAAASNRAGLGARVLALASPPPTGTASRSPPWCCHRSQSPAVGTAWPHLTRVLRLPPCQVIDVARNSPATVSGFEL